MLEDANELEQGEEVKKWIKENISTMIMGVAIGLSGLYGWKYFQTGQVQKKSEASDRYVAVQLAVAEDNKEGIAAQLEVLDNEYNGTPYPAISGLIVSQKQFESGDIDGAEKTLNKVIAIADKDVADLARLHLARIKFQQNDTDKAMNLLTTISSEALSGVLSELEADIELSRGNSAKAKELYERALDELPAGSGNRQYLNMKLESLAS